MEENKTLLNGKDVSKKETKPTKAKSNKLPMKVRLSKMWRDFKSEFKKIVWSNRRNTFNNTVLVVVSMVVIAVVIGLLDLGFSKLVLWLGKLI